MSYPPQGYQQAPPPGRPPGKQRLRGRIPLILATIFGVIGVALGIIGIVLLVQAPIANTEDFPRAALDGQPHQVELTRTGNYVGYYEEPNLDTSQDSRSFSVRITDSSGRPVNVSRYSTNTSLSYDTGGHHGLAAVKFRIPKSGTYTVQSQSSVASGAELALGESIAHGLVAAVLLFVFGLLLVVVAVVLLIVGLVKRSRHKREIASAYGGYGGHPGGYQPPPPSYPPPGN